MEGLKNIFMPKIYGKTLMSSAFDINASWHFIIESALFFWGGGSICQRLKSIDCNQREVVLVLTQSQLRSHELGSLLDCATSIQKQYLYPKYSHVAPLDVREGQSTTLYST